MTSVDEEPTQPHDPVEEEEEPDEIQWNLGFVEEPEKPHLLMRHRFPSKVGGRPAWLDPLRLPSTDMLTCKASGKPLDFLLQVYAPVDANPDEGFHRALFLFISPEGSRLKEPGAVRLFRCQMPRRNAFYSSDPPRDKDKFPNPLSASDADASRARDPWRSVDAERPASATSSGGPASTSSPAAAKRKGKGKGGAAPTAAANGAAAEGSVAAAPLPREGVRGPGGLYPELELIVEPEEDYMDEWEEEEDGAAEGGKEAEKNEKKEDDGRVDDAKTETDAGEAPATEAGAGAAAGAAEKGSARGGVEAEVRRALEEYRRRVATEGELNDEELPPDVMEALEANAAPEQRCFVDFQARVSWAPEQVIRYCFQDGAQPLWPAPHCRPKPGDVPACSRCGAARKPEFQVLPQLLHYLRLDEEDPASPDWSTLVAYTCSASCSLPPAEVESSQCAYTEEVVWVQPSVTQ
ncbi:hypothetical protein CHLRE_03g149500v5 [Chlamydomonas reinhardtii]|uniref:Programmed cell death protein 2 C-terminal domain-containing protein n=1 Tax=Chlamydomonas reinhardtii TaxID=3055 RepID=A0A2K3DVJ9_CHLRE|nr:uncharacterized protein CHLRE_03g149500v5 [Chlamydomonas reinhardtii]PNW84571.1 hypothetical protein CHLRE_03g149500v5 [Chlamydomonas reinhardtii]